MNRSIEIGKNTDSPKELEMRVERHVRNLWLKGKVKPNDIVTYWTNDIPPKKIAEITIGESDYNMKKFM